MAGAFNYIGEHIQELLEEIGDEGEMEDRFPMLAALMKSLGEWVGKTEHTLDLDFSGEAEIDLSDPAFDLAATGALIDRILKLLPEMLFPLSKKATIEKWQALTGSTEVTSFVGENYPRGLWAE